MLIFAVRANETAKQGTVLAGSERACVWRHWALTGDFIESYKNKIITEKNNQLRPLRQRIEWCICSVLVYKCLHDRRSTNRSRRNVQVAPVSIHLHLSTEVISSLQHMAIWQYLAPVAYKEIPRCFALSLFLVPLCGTHCPAADGASLTLTQLCALLKTVLFCRPPPWQLGCKECRANTCSYLPTYLLTITLGTWPTRSHL